MGKANLSEGSIMSKVLLLRIDARSRIWRVIALCIILGSRGAGARVSICQEEWKKLVWDHIADLYCIHNGSPARCKTRYGKCSYLALARSRCIVKGIFEKASKCKIIKAWDRSLISHTTFVMSLKTLYIRQHSRRTCMLGSLYRE